MLTTISGSIADKKDCQQLDGYLDTGSQHSYRSNAMTARLQRSQKEYGAYSQYIYNTLTMRCNYIRTSTRDPNLAS